MIHDFVPLRTEIVSSLRLQAVPDFSARHSALVATKWEKFWVVDESVFTSSSTNGTKVAKLTWLFPMGFMFFNCFFF